MPLQKVKQLYCEQQGAEIGPVVLMVKFVSGEKQITLDTPDETWTKDSWSLCPLSSPCVRKSVVCILYALTITNSWLPADKGGTGCLCWRASSSSVSTAAENGSFSNSHGS